MIPLPWTLDHILYPLALRNLRHLRIVAVSLSPSADSCCFFIPCTCLPAGRSPASLLIMGRARLPAAGHQRYNHAMNTQAGKFATATLLAMAALAVAAAAGCADESCPPILLDTAGVAPAVDYGPLGEVLAACVLGNGLANREELPRRAQALDRQLAILAVTGPTATPALFAGHDDALAYWYNAHAAWSLKLLSARGCPHLIGAAAMLDRKFPLDGRTMTLRGIGAILAAEDDFRIAACVPGATTNHARLPESPVEARGFRQSVQRRFADLLDDDIRIYIDVRRMRVLFPPVLWQFRARLTAEYNRKHQTEGATLVTALLGYTSGPAQRRMQTALGYREVEAVSRQLLSAEKKNRDGEQ